MPNTNFLHYGVYADGLGYVFIKQREEGTPTVDKSINIGHTAYIAYFEDWRDNGYWVMSHTPDMSTPYAIEKIGDHKVRKCNRHVRTDYDTMNTGKFLGTYGYGRMHR